jgi:uncharacterized protein (TIGR00730 family)
MNFSGLHLMKNIVVFCGSKIGNDPELACLTAEFGKILAQQGYAVVYGGANSGLMGVMADTVLKHNGKMIGIMPTVLEGQERVHPRLSELIEVTDMATRKTAMVETGDAFVALPGGTGTLDELFEVFTLSQIGEHYKPCAVLNLKGYFDPLLAFLKQACDQGFLHSDYFDMLIVDDDPVCLLEKLIHFQHPHLK